MSLLVWTIDASAALHGAPHCGVRRFGVPPGGPFDRFSAACANALVGNPPEAAVFELGAFGATFDVIEPATVGLMGPEIEAVGVGGLGRWRLEAGSRLVISRLIGGARLYLAMPGGVVGPQPAGPLSLRPILKGSQLVARTDAVFPDLRVASVIRPTPLLTYVPRDPDNALHARLSGTHLKVGLNSNRVGVRLIGFPETHAEERLSEPVAAGTLQWTPSGELIVLGPDGPTVGGYPRLGFLTDSAMDAIAQVRPGDAIRLRPVGFAEAVQMEKKIAAVQAQTLAALRP